MEAFSKRGSVWDLSGDCRAEQPMSNAGAGVRIGEGCRSGIISHNDIGSLKLTPLGCGRFELFQGFCQQRQPAERFTVRVTSDVQGAALRSAVAVVMAAELEVG